MNKAPLAHIRVSLSNLGLLKVNLLSIADLCERWVYTKAGIHKLTNTEKFPKPIAIVQSGSGISSTRKTRPPFSI
jgi:hypothetical protein